MDSTTPPLLPGIMDQKRCYKCGAVKPVGEFPPRERVCRDCRAAYQRDWRTSRNCPPQMTGEKTCTHCLDTKPISEFHAQTAASDGRASWCIECHRNLSNKYKSTLNYPPQSEGEKACTRCGYVKPRTAFPPARHVRDGRNSWCRKCDRETKLILGTGADFNWKATQWMIQDGKCEVCLDALNLDESVVDHVEVEGVKIPQAVLHNLCNASIGGLRHDPDILRGAEEYCERTR